MWNDPKWLKEDKINATLLDERCVARLIARAHAHIDELRLALNAKRSSITYLRDEIRIRALAVSRIPSSGWRPKDVACREEADAIERMRNTVPEPIGCVALLNRQTAPETRDA